MNEYRIEKVRQHVRLVMVGGTTLDGEVFLQPTARYRIGPQNPEELFNDHDPVVPIDVGNGNFILVAKDHVRMVQFSESEADTEIGDSAEAIVDVLFADGGRFAGELRFQARSDRPRLLDFLNSDHQRFLTLRTAEGNCLVNRTQIAQIRERR
jgi:hypothetical protein